MDPENQKGRHPMIDHSKDFLHFLEMSDISVFSRMFVCIVHFAGRGSQPISQKRSGKAPLLSDRDKIADLLRRRITARLAIIDRTPGSNFGHKARLWSSFGYKARLVLKIT